MGNTKIQNLLYTFEKNKNHENKFAPVCIFCAGTNGL